MKIPDGMVFDRSNQDFWSVTYNVVSRCVFGSPQDDDYYKQILEQVLESLKTSDHVTIIGHSYGGSVALKCMKNLVNHPMRHKIHVITFASISKIPVSKKIRLTQLMNIGDIALTCSNTRQPKRYKTRVHMLHDMGCCKKYRIDACYRNGIYWIKNYMDGMKAHFNYPAPDFTQKKVSIHGGLYGMIYGNQ